MAVNAAKITISDKDHEARLRDQVKGPLYVDVPYPDFAFACATSGNIISFGRAIWLIEPGSVICAVCGTENTI